MHIKSAAGLLELIDESRYAGDQLKKYPFAKDLAPDYRPSSIHGFWLNGKPTAVFSNAGGATTVTEHSAVYLDGRLYIAVGNGVVCVRTDPFEHEWSLQVDSATCFGIHFDAGHQALISHGELEIARISKSGSVLWSTGGADIFTGEFSLGPQCIGVTDFNGKRYRFKYEDGQPIG
jgi:hypothetical protein